MIFLLGQDIATLFDVPMNRLEEVHLFKNKPRGDPKIGLRLYLADQAKCSNLEALKEGDLG